MRKLVVDVISQLTLAALGVLAFMLCSVLIRILWEGFLLGFTIFGLWP
jgi:hypothetical protein